MGIIYCATNKINGKIYIGETIQCLKKRMAQHKSAGLCNSEYYFHRAIKKYGWDNFYFIVLEYLDNTEIFEKENMWIIASNANNPNIGYNMNEGGKGQRGNHNSYQKKHKKWSEESKKRFSESHTGSKNYNFGKHFSEKHREKLRLSNIGKNKGKHHTDESKIKIGNRSRGYQNPNAHPIINNDTQEVFLTIQKAVNKYKIISSNVVKCCQGKRNTCGGYHWAYYKEEN
jgi:group I intron endonuclease